MDYFVCVMLQHLKIVFHWSSMSSTTCFGHARSLYTLTSNALKWHIWMESIVHIFRGVLISEAWTTLTAPICHEKHFALDNLSEKGAAMAKRQSLVEPCACRIKEECLAGDVTVIVDFLLTSAWTRGTDREQGLSSPFGPQKSVPAVRDFSLHSETLWLRHTSY